MASIVQSKQMFLRLKNSVKCTMDTTEDVGFFSPEILEIYDVMELMNASGDVLNAAQQANCQALVRSGEGISVSMTPALPIIISPRPFGW